MNTIPVRHLKKENTERKPAAAISTRKLEDFSDREMVQEIHRHDFYYLLALETGNGIHEIDFITYAVTDRSIFFMRPGQVHRIRVDAGCKGYLLQFGTDFYLPFEKNAAGWLRGAGRINHYRPDETHFGKLLTALSYIYDENAQQKAEYENVIRSQLSILFIELIRGNERTPKAPLGLHTQEQLEKFLTLLEQNIFKHKQVADYAGMMNLSVYQLNKITRETLNKTCSELIDEQILLESKRCLLATPHQVKQISYHLGYEDISYFTRFFKKHTGYTPEAFRRKFR